jgi:alkylhydroperoxidase/carboxymuconolactone decarboxylase family protein YurZ
MDVSNKEAMFSEFKEQFGFVPPCGISADLLGKDMGELIADYHHLIWQEGVIPLKYRYLMALATAVYNDEDARAKLELLKAIRHGATHEEVIEVFRQQVWMRGTPLILRIQPLIKYLDAVMTEKQVKV